jgi:hypothetical protein
MNSRMVVLEELGCPINTNAGQLLRSLKINEQAVAMQAATGGTSPGKCSPTTTFQSFASVAWAFGSLCNIVSSVAMFGLLGLKI